MIEDVINRMQRAYLKQYKTNITVRKIDMPQMFYELVLWDMLLFNNDPVTVYLEGSKNHPNELGFISDGRFCVSEALDGNKWRLKELIKKHKLKINSISDIYKRVDAEYINIYTIREFGSFILEFDKFNNQK